MNPNFNVTGIRQRKSTLGRRYRNIEKPPILPVVFPVPHITTGLGRSAKKEALLAKSSRDYSTRKQLFLNQNSPTESSIGSQSFQDITGIQSITSPSPSATATHVQKQRSFDYPPHVYKTTMTKINPILFDLEQPKSPDPSRYFQLIMSERLEQPVDPDDLVVNEDKCLDLSLGNLTLENNPRSTNVHSPTATTESIKSRSKVSSLFSPHLSSTCIKSGAPSPEQEPKMNVSSASKLGLGTNLSVIGEDLDTTDAFLMQEQTILEQDCTLVAKEDINRTGRYSIFDNCSKIKLKPAEDGNSTSTSDEELDQLMENLTALENNFKRDVTLLKTSIHRLIDKKKRRKNNMVIEDKENIPTSVSSCTKNLWKKALKSENPELLKTPRVSQNSTRARVSNKSLVWTPHSLSTVIYDQVDELFA